MNFLYEVLKRESEYKALLSAIDKGRLPLVASGLSDISKSENKLKLLYINQFVKDVESREQVKEAMMKRFAKTSFSPPSLW